MDIRSKYIAYKNKRPFLGYITESVNGLVLFEGFVGRMLDKILDDNTFYKKAMETFKNYKNDESFDKEWLDILTAVCKKHGIEMTSDMWTKLLNVVPMEFYNYIQDNGK